VTAIPEEEANDYLNKLSNHFLDATIFITGLQVQNFTFKLPQNVKVIENVYQFKDEISSLS